MLFSPLKQSIRRRWFVDNRHYFLWWCDLSTHAVLAVTLSIGSIRAPFASELVRIRLEDCGAGHRVTALVKVSQVLGHLLVGHRVTGFLIVVEIPVLGDDFLDARVAQERSHGIEVQLVEVLNLVAEASACFVVYDCDGIVTKRNDGVALKSEPGGRPGSTIPFTVKTPFTLEKDTPVGIVTP